jgi:hypothetical protein
VEWIARRLDTFLAAVIIAAAAIAACQSQAFIIQYLQRLNGELTAARTELSGIENGLRYKLMSDTVRQEIETAARAKTQALQKSYDSVADTNLFIRPIVLARSGDPALIDTTWRGFVPALPRSPGSIAFAVLGMIVGFVVYEAVKFPFLLLIREPRRRKFRKRG